MNDLERGLAELFKLVREEASRNVEFANRLEAIWKGVVEQRGEGRETSRQAPATEQAASFKPSESKRGNRRARAMVDPIAQIHNGEARLREQLEPLSLEQLRDVVAEYRMDPSKLVMKWKDRLRVIDHIVVTAATRGRKGDAFRS